MALQPDFNAIARGISDLSDQVRLCANLPAVDHGARLFELLEELRTIVIDTREAVRRLEERVGPIETRLDTSDLNATARIFNMTVTRDDYPLEPLLAATTGQEIPHFPPTVSTIAGMQSAEVNVVLQALRRPVTGTLAERRRRLKTTIGVVMQQI